MMRVRSVAAIALVVVLLPTPTAHAADTFVGNTRTALESLVVADEVRDGYQRSLFRHWIDADGDGCNTRYEVLIAEAVKKPKVGAGCRLSGGRWVSAYDGFQTSQPTALDIDHVVPLAEAWDSGARSWNADQRMAFANDLGDPRSLIAVSATSNRQKSDQDPAEWLPVRARCTYLVQWIAVKVRWSLSIDPAEKRALTDLIGTCGIASVRVQRMAVNAAPQPLPSGTTSAAPTGSPTSTPSPTATSSNYIYPGAFCTPEGAIGYSAKGVQYTCKPSATDSRNRWRR